jgi:hypothetical protein
MRDLRPRFTIVCAAVVAVTIVACARNVRVVQLTPDAPATIAELWQAPSEPRDLFHGPGGKELAPGTAPFTFVAADTTGYSPGFDVKDAAGLEWSVKTGPEAQSEVVTSRILWAIGFHQPPTYYVGQWSMTGGPISTPPPARFRPELPGRRVTGDWPWHENPFVGTPEYGGLIVANLILTSWDWKTSNNKIYELDTPINGVRRWFVVRDLGASLGKFTYPTILRLFRLRGFGQGTRNDLPGFEQQGFIEKVEDGSVSFVYRGIYRDVISTVTAAQVRWACERLAKLSDQQWSDAFRSGGYTADQSRRYTNKIKEKIAQGLQLAGAAH